MSSEIRTRATLTRVREAQAALDKAETAIASVQSGLAAVETVAKKTESPRRHPLRTAMIALLGAIVMFGALIALNRMDS